MAEVPDVGAFLLGAPKCGTTWLAEVLTQHPEICVSDPKEPNIIATHKGTFGRDDSEPDWGAYSDCFNGEGLRIDCSVHAMACPVAPSRVANNWPNARLIICLREPVSRTVSHWNMILDTKEDCQNGADWRDFGVAWADSRLSGDTLYGAAIAGWLEHFERDSILLIEANRMRHEASMVLEEVCNHLSISTHSFDLESVHNANTAEGRRPMTVFGRVFRFTASMLPGFVKGPIVRRLQSRGVNVYKMPILSSKAPSKRDITEGQKSLLAEGVNADLALLEKSTGFDCSKWFVQ